MNADLKHRLLFFFSGAPWLYFQKISFMFWSCTIYHFNYLLVFGEPSVWGVQGKSSQRHPPHQRARGRPGASAPGETSRDSLYRERRVHCWTRWISIHGKVRSVTSVCFLVNKRKNDNLPFARWESGKRIKENGLGFCLMSPCPRLHFSISPCFHVSISMFP
jgi:hypothetical protein